MVLGAWMGSLRWACVFIGALGGACSGNATTTDTMGLTDARDDSDGDVHRATVSKDLLTPEAALLLRARVESCLRGASETDVLRFWTRVSVLTGRSWEVYGALLKCQLEAADCPAYHACLGIDVYTECELKTFEPYCKDDHTLVRCVYANGWSPGRLQTYDCQALEPYDVQCRTDNFGGVACMGADPKEQGAGCVGSVLYRVKEPILTKVDCADLGMQCFQNDQFLGCAPSVQDAHDSSPYCKGNICINPSDMYNNPYTGQQDCSWLGQGVQCMDEDSYARCRNPEEECQDGHTWCDDGLLDACLGGHPYVVDCATVPGGACVHIPQCHPSDFPPDGPPFAGRSYCQEYGPRCANMEFVY